MLRSDREGSFATSEANIFCSHCSPPRWTCRTGNFPLLKLGVRCENVERGVCQIFCGNECACEFTLQR